MMHRWVARLYALLLRLYPPAFRAAFAEEMQAVFAETVCEEGELRPLMRELRDWPGSVWRAYRGVHPSTEAVMNQATCKTVRGAWWEAALAGLPHLLFALMLYGPAMAYELRTYGWVEIYAPLRNSFRYGYSYPLYLRQGFWALVFAFILVGLWRKVPRWSASWVGYGLQWLVGWLVQLAPYSVVLNLLVLVAWLTLTLGTIFWLGRRDPLTGLLVLLPLVPMGSWLFSMEVVLTDLEGLLYIPAGLLVGIVAALAVRRGHFWSAVWSVLAVILVMGLPINYSTTVYNYSAILHPSPSLGAGATTVNPLALFGQSFDDLLIFATFGVPLWLLLARRARRVAS